MKSEALLVLLHGTCLNGGQWAPYGPLLADVAEVLAPDLPGHGQRAGERFSLARAVEGVEALIDAAGQRPVILGGHSLGGFVAMSVAERLANRLAGLALMGSATEPAGPGSPLYRWLARAMQRAGPERMRRVHEHTLGRWADAHLWSAVRARGEHFGAVNDAWNEVMRHCGSRQLRRVTCPVLVLGGRWDQLHLQARRFAAAAPRGQAVTVPRRTHLWPLTHPQEVAAHLRRWLLDDVLPTAERPRAPAANPATRPVT